MTNTTNEEKTCPYCQTPIQPGAPVIVCNACGSTHHAECWQQNRGCTTFGCHGGPAAARAPEPPPALFTASIPPPLLSQNNPPPGYLPAILPPELRKWNWGAFFLALFWSAAMRQWFWFALCFIPYVSIIPHIYLAIKGNELSWQSRNWESLEQFKATQDAWKRWGIGVFCCCFLLIPIFAAILFPVFAKAREKARTTTCMNNQRQLSMAILIYTEDNKGILPTEQAVWKTIGADDRAQHILVCPTVGVDTPNSYGYNQQLSGLTVDNLKQPNMMLMTADSSDSTNIIHSAQDIAFRHRHNAMGSFCDGHVAAIPEGQPIRLEP